jgi:hypothetical protein
MGKRIARLASLAIIAMTLSLYTAAAGQGRAAAGTAPSWDRWAFVLGDWVGDGSGEPGQGAGRFSFAFDLERRILVRKNHTEIPAAQGRPASVHDDLLIVYPEGGRTRAVYFDNEDHVISYTLEPSTEPSVLALVSDRTPGAPRFRLVYRAAPGGRLAIRFEIAQPDKPDSFVTYLEGTARRIK